MGIGYTIDDSCIPKLLENIIKTEGFPGNPTIRIESGSEAGDGYIGINSAIEIENDNQIIRLFAKTAPKSEKVRNQLPIKDFFVREIYFYETVYPKFLKFQRKLNVKEPFKSVAKCYVTTIENLNEVLILENLRAAGYVLWNRKNQMNSEHIKCVFKQYANFHAVSYAMKDQNPAMFEKLSENLTDLILVCFKTAGLDVQLTQCCEEAKKVFDPVKDAYISNHIKNLTEILNETVEKANEFVDEYSVITHGDCWCNNFMFKYKDHVERSTPDDVKILDWQLMQLNSPVLDLSDFFYGVATREAMQNLNIYMRTYHDALSEHITEMGSDPDKLYPYSVFQEHWRKFSRYGLARTLGFMKVMLSEQEEVPNTIDSIELGKTFGDAFTFKIKNKELYDLRIRNIIEHFVNNKFI